MNRFTKLTATSTFVAALMASPVVAQEDVGEWDADADGVVTEEEFGTGWGETEAFEGWDENQDEMIDEDEYNAGVFGGYDADDSGDWNEEEQATFQDDRGEEGFWDW